MARASATNPAKDPRYRSFRVGAYSVYLVIATVFSVLLIRSVVVSLQNMAPPQLEPQPALSVRDCAAEAQQLWSKLDRQRQRLADDVPTIHADESWTRFRTQWMGELRQTEAQCDLDSPQRDELRNAFRLLVKAQDLYTTHAVQFSGEVGPTVDELTEAIQAVQRSP